MGTIFIGIQALYYYIDIIFFLQPLNSIVEFKDPQNNKPCKQTMTFSIQSIFSHEATLELVLFVCSSVHLSVMLDQKSQASKSSVKKQASKSSVKIKRKIKCQNQESKSSIIKSLKYFSAAVLNKAFCSPPSHQVSSKTSFF